MVKVFKFGLMELGMMERGPREKLLVRVSLLMLMEIFMMANGKMIKLMVMESIFMQKLEQDMKATGKMICSMDLELKLTHKVINMKECLSKVKETGKVSIP